MVGESPFVRSFECPACGASQQIRALGLSKEFACANCSNLIDISVEPYSILAEAAQVKYNPRIPLGARGSIQGRKYECIGFMVRSDPTGEYPWEEYLLFNPYYGFRWLMTMDGHWNFISPIHGDLETPVDKPIELGSQRFRLFLRDTAHVRFVLGEFYWRVKVGDAVAVWDFIDPPFTISLEVDENERNLSIGEYIEPHEIERAFLLPLRTLPSRRGVFPNQPSQSRRNRSLYLIGFTVFALCLIVIQLAFHRVAEPVTVVQTGVRSGAERSAPILTETFEFTDHGNLLFTLESPVNNSWVDAEIMVVNAADQTATETAIGVSYYHGYEGGDSWSEGNRKDYITLGDVPAGRYYFSFSFSSGGNTNPQALTPATITILRHAPYWGNFWLAFILGAIPVGVNIVRSASFEARRWSTSTEVAITQES